FVPTSTFPRNGLLIKEMSQPQRALAHELVKAGLSQRGYLTASSIMDLETVLGALEAEQRASAAQPPRAAPIVRDPEGYFFAVFGTPSTKDTWAWRVEGHHISLNFTIVNGTLVAGSPAFFGSNPAEVRAGAKKDLLMKLVDIYTGFMAEDIAAERMARIRKAGVEKIGFAWAGETERGKKHYYRVQGPTFLIEYDNTQNDGNHIHSVWRDFDGDFGRDLLREHLRSFPH